MGGQDVPKRRVINKWQNEKKFSSGWMRIPKEVEARNTTANNSTRERKKKAEERNQLPKTFCEDLKLPRIYNG